MGLFFPNKESTPNEKAISVADGIAQPFRVSESPKFIKTYTNAGTNIPPTAPIIGNNACLIFDSSPCKNSLLISKVTKKKNIAIKASFIQCNTDSFRPKLLIPMNKYLFNVSKYKLDKVELLIIKAIIAANNNTKPLAASS